MASTVPEHVGEVHNHWWWRPGWREGRHFYACHLTLADQSDLRHLIQRYQAVLAGLPGLDLIPARWLHLTMQGIGFTDEISTDQLAQITARLRNRLSAANPPTVTFHLPTVRREAVYLPANPAKPLYELRARMHGAITAALAPGHRVEPLPEARRFHPHVSAAYVNADGLAEPIITALDGIDTRPVTVTFRVASLLTFHRDHRMYEWTEDTQIPIGQIA